MKKRKLKKLFKNNTLTIELDMLHEEVIFCYGNEAYNQVIKNMTGEDHHHIVKDGVSSTFTKGRENKYVIGCIKKPDNISLLNYKGLIVHEISHCVTSIITDTGIDNDEFRSTILQYLYCKIINFVDNKFF
jgi:hypothetical protein